jgi:putative transposase
MRIRLQTYALTAVAYNRMRLFQRTVNADLFLATVLRYRDTERLLLHGYVIMPDHIHVLITPTESIEKTAQLIKGGFSFAVRKQYAGEVWQNGYHAHRVVSDEDYANQLRYIASNPKKRNFRDYAFVHTTGNVRLDPPPSQGPGG